MLIEIDANRVLCEWATLIDSPRPHHLCIGNEWIHDDPGVPSNTWLVRLTAFVLLVLEEKGNFN